MSFKDFLNERAAKVSLKKYSWGTLASVTNGAVTAVLHPENIEAVSALSAGETYQFTDEQNYKWNASVSNGVVLLKSGSKKLEFAQTDLNKE